MKLGILGTGMIVKDFLTMKDQLELESIDLLATPATLEEANMLKERYALDRVYVDYDELLSSDVDTIYIALPNFLHYAFAKKALEVGKHVIVEKPGTSKASEMEELIALAKKNDRILVEAMTIGYNPIYQLVKEQIGRLGTIKIVSMNYSQYSSRYDAFKRGEILPAFDPKKAGGALYDINVYNLHFILGLFGEPKAIEYEANVERGIDTSGILTLDYGTFKAVLIGAKDCKAPMMNTIQGDEAALVIPTSVNIYRAFDVDHNDGHIEHFSTDPDTHRMLFEFETFIDWIDQHKVEESRPALEVSLLASKIMEEARKQAGIVFGSD